MEGGLELPRREIFGRIWLRLKDRLAFTGAPGKQPMPSF